MTARVDYRTVRRPQIQLPPVGHAATAGDCPLCDDPVEPGHDVALHGHTLAPDGDGGTRVDLSDAEWGHQRCVLAVAEGVMA